MSAESLLVPPTPPAAEGSAPPAQNATPPAAPPASETPPADKPASWLDGLDEEARAYAANKGWKPETGPADIFNSYRNLEKLLGADRAGRTVVIPGENAKPEEWNEVFDKLGRPKDPKDYKIDLPEGSDTAFADTMRSVFHEAGLPKAAGEKIAAKYREIETAAIEAYNKASAAEVEALKQEWGAQFDQRLETARAAIRAAGIPEAKVRQFEQALGPAEAIKTFEFFGRNYTEAQPPQPESRLAGFGSLNITPGAAAAKIAELKADPAFQARYNSENYEIRSKAIEEMNALHARAVNAKR